MTEVFDTRFRQTLGEILRHAPRVRISQQHALRSRRRRRSTMGTFSGHRAYTPGEDLRNLDWNAYARTDELFLKVLEDEDRVGATLVLDRSRSMAADDRFVGAKRLCAILGGLALVHLDGLHIVLGGGGELILQGASSLPRLLEVLENLEPLDVEPRQIAAELLTRGVSGRLAWISDFAVPQDYVLPLAMLRKHGARCRGWLPTLAADQLPDADGTVLFQDPETGRQELLQVDAKLRSAMAAELRRLAQEQDAVFKAAGFQLVRYRVPEPGDYRMASWSVAGLIYGSR